MLYVQGCVPASVQEVLCEHLLNGTLSSSHKQAGRSECFSDINVLPSHLAAG